MEEWIWETATNFWSWILKWWRSFWEYAPISTNEVTEKLTQTTDWSPKTIQTMLKRLVTKKALTYEKQSRVFVYTPLVPETEYIRQESNSFLNKYYNGNIVSMLTSYLEMIIIQNRTWYLASSSLWYSRIGGIYLFDLESIFNMQYFYSIFIGIMTGIKHLLRKCLSARMQYRLWFLLLSFMAVPFYLQTFSLSCRNFQPCTFQIFRKDFFSLSLMDRFS